MEKQMKLMFEHIVNSQEDGKMLHQVLKNRFKFSRRMMSRLKMNRLVTVNGEVIYYTARVQQGDQIEIQFLVEDAEYIPPQPTEFTVVYEDEDLIVVDKPPGLVVHPTKGYPDQTLANGLMHYWLERGETHKVRPVTRLDKNTSGLMVVGKHAYTHAYLAEQMAEKRYQREYLAWVHHQIIEDQGTIDDPIGMDMSQTIFRSVREDGAQAITHFRVIQRWEDATLVRLQLETGRTHQIRIHLSARGYPIIGDDMYGTKEDQHLITRQALHATYLRLYHPRHRKWMEWESPIPEDIQELMKRLNKK
ncbi:RluA family pseudouridine synthase [Hazenella coriacea]|uniref:Pseudouridine synthase n=1 Tax=Hazenella coriacea TaxID=1179467 RepID=A0A4R3L9K7_9BACL|nr:RluA family pseudouridine synthase [Hazenella coriacea]TCS95908.1 23S rRNA pseudouridine1911/1915/1917 synthase [Hazenella coriacea]